MHSWKIYRNAPQALEAMMVRLRVAEKRIDLEQFIFQADVVGEEFAKILIDRARNGVSVRLLVDYAGSFAFCDSPLFKTLINAGVSVTIFNKVQLWRMNRLFSWAFRSHRKILIVDGAVAFTGGVGIRDAGARRDTTVEISGPVVAEMEYAFERMWQSAVTKKFLRFRNLARRDHGFDFLINSPRVRQRFYYKELLAQIRRAKSRIHLVSPYFVPDTRFLALLTQASRRGVDVRIVLPRATDHPIVDLAARSYVSILLWAGIDVYFHESFNHAKTFVIDDWASVGSFNLDNLSFLWSYEGMLASWDPLFVRQMAKEFEMDRKESEHVVKHAWHNRGWKAKFLELLTWPIHKFI